MMTEIGNFDDPSTLMMAIPKTLFDPSWYPDSGASATNHVTPDSFNLLTKTPYHGGSKVKVANGSSTNIKHIGFFFPHNSIAPLFLSNLLYVPRISKNLSSASICKRKQGIF